MADYRLLSATSRALRPHSRKMKGVAETNEYFKETKYDVTKPTDSLL